MCRDWSELQISPPKKTKKSQRDEDDDVDDDVDLVEWNGVEVNAHRAVTRNEEMELLKKYLLDFIEIKRHSVETVCGVKYS